MLPPPCRSPTEQATKVYRSSVRGSVSLLKTVTALNGTRASVGATLNRDLSPTENALYTFGVFGGRLVAVLAVGNLLKPLHGEGAANQTLILMIAALKKTKQHSPHYFGDFSGSGGIFGSACGAHNKKRVEYR